jgi:hemerythrin-like domain-containing protein
MPRQKTNGSQAAAAQAATDAISLLKADHKSVQDMFKAYEKLCKDDETDPEDKHELASQICAELTVHAQIEEEIFYPALREALDDEDILDEALVEHATAKDLIAQLQEMDIGEEFYDAKVIVLGEYVNHHVEEEQGEMFKRARKARVNMDALGEQLRARKEELMAEMGIFAAGDRDDDVGNQRAGGEAKRGSSRGSRSRASA